MMTARGKLAAVVIILLVSIVSIYQFVVDDEVQSSTLSYLIDDAMIDGGNRDLMLGSSTIKRLNQHQFLKCGFWLNRGIGNSTISSLRSYLSLTPLSINPSKILLYAGENDISKGISVTETIEAYKRLVKILLNKYPGSKLHVIAIKPSPSRRIHWNEFSMVNNSLEIYAKEFSQVYFHPHPTGSKGFNRESFENDGVHLTDQGYSIFTIGINKVCKTN